MVVVGAAVVRWIVRIVTLKFVNGVVGCMQAKVGTRLNYHHRLAVDCTWGRGLGGHTRPCSLLRALMREC